MLQRRILLAATSAGLATSAVSLANLGASAQPAGPYTLPPLPYPPDANEPSIDALTMTIHHDRHHGAYVANLNTALKDHGHSPPCRSTSCWPGSTRCRTPSAPPCATMAAGMPTIRCSGR